MKLDVIQKIDRFVEAWMNLYDKINEIVSVINRMNSNFNERIQKLEEAQKRHDAEAK